MEILNWINKDLEILKNDLLYKEYFQNIPVEKGIDVFMLLSASFGIDIILTENFFVKAIHFYSGNDDEVNQFMGKLPYDLKFSFSQLQVRKILGCPKISGEINFSFLYGKTPPWDKYLFDEINLHIQYSEEKNKITLISIFGE